MLPSFLHAGIEHANPDDAIEKLRLILKVLGTFKGAVIAYKTASAKTLSNSAWRVQNNSLFVSLDVFMARCQTMLDLTSTIHEASSCCLSIMDTRNFC